MTIINKPAWVSNDSYTSWHALVEGWGHEVLAHQTFGQYQGDLIYILKEGDRYGIAVIGYGSCSGCDALEAVVPETYDDRDQDWTDVATLAERVHNQVEWYGDRKDLADRLTADASGNKWWEYDDEVNAWLLRIAIELGSGQL